MSYRDPVAAEARIHHLALRTGDMARLVEFYTRWLGAKVVRDRAPQSVWLGLGQGAVLMIEAAASEEPSPPPGCMDLVAFQVSAETRVELRGRFVQEGLLEGETEFTLYVRDPDGRRVGFSSYVFEG